MNKMNKVFKRMICDKEELKKKIDESITNRKEKNVFVRNKRIIEFGLTCAFVVTLGVLLLLNNNDTNNKIVTTTPMLKNANYNILVLNNMDSYVEKNVDLDIIQEGEGLDIDTTEFISSDEFATCSGVVTIEKEGSSGYKYTISSSCTDDSEEGQSLVIKRYENLNNIHLGNMLDIEPLSNGYIALFGYINGTKDESCNEICTTEYDTVALVKISADGELGNPVLLDKTLAGYTNDEKVNMVSIDVATNGYYIHGSNQIKDEDVYKSIYAVAKFDSNLNQLWAKKYTEEIDETVILDNSIALCGMDGSLYIINEEDGALSNKISFKIDEESNSLTLKEMIYYNNNFYYYSYGDYALEKNVLYKFNFDGKLLYSKDLKQTQEDMGNSGALLYVTNKNIIINNQTDIRIYDLSGNYLRKHSYSEDLIREWNTETVIVDNEGNYSLINKSGEDFLIEQFNSEGQKISSGIYGVNYDMDQMQNTPTASRYLAQSNALIIYNYSLDNNGKLLMLIVK